MRYWLVLLIAMTLSRAYVCADENRYPGFYVGALGGASFIDFKETEFKTDSDTGFMVGAFGGYRFCNGLRLEAELAFRRNAVSNMWFQGIELEAHGHTELTTAMANLIYAIPVPLCVSPYVGFGVGYAHLNQNASGRGNYIEGKGDWFAWQTILGVSYALSCSDDIGLEYRYLHPGQYIDAQSVNLAITHRF